MPERSAGETSHGNDAIVRALHREPLPGTGRFSETVKLRLDPSWTGELAVVALWQDPVGRLIGDAARAPVRE